MRRWTTARCACLAKKAPSFSIVCGAYCGQAWLYREAAVGRADVTAPEVSVDRLAMVRVYEAHHTSVVEAVICQRGKARHSILLARVFLLRLPHALGTAALQTAAAHSVVGRTRVVGLVKHIVAADDVVANIEIAAIDLHALPRLDWRH